MCQRIKQRSLTNRLMGHVGLVLVRGSHLLLCSRCSTVPMQLGMDGKDNEGFFTARFITARRIARPTSKNEVIYFPRDGEEPSTSMNAWEAAVKVSDSDEEAVAHVQLLKDEIRKNILKQFETERQISSIQREKRARENDERRYEEFLTAMVRNREEVWRLNDQTGDRYETRCRACNCVYSMNRAAF